MEVARQHSADGAYLMEATTRRGPYAKTADRIERILDVALELFASRGYRAATMKEIAERAGLTQPGLVHHFPTKADVLIALLRRRDEHTAALTPEASTLPPVERLMAIIDDIYDNRLLVTLYCVLSAEATSPDHPAHEYFKHRYASVIHRTTEAFTILQREGGLRSDSDPATLAHTMIGLLDGLQQQWLYDPDSVDIKRAFRAFLDLCSA